jgi:hypothetical protein
MPLAVEDTLGRRTLGERDLLQVAERLKMLSDVGATPAPTAQQMEEVRALVPGSSQLPDEVLHHELLLWTDAFRDTFDVLDDLRSQLDHGVEFEIRQMQEAKRSADLVLSALANRLRRLASV